jgi:DNA-binding transcriptional LysR family regulator
MAVAQWGSMAKAAAHLRISQPAISKAIADMEHTLGVRLLDRLAQGIEPTLYGRALLKSAAAVFDDVRQGINEIEFLGDSTAGEVRIGATEAMTAGLLPIVLDRLHCQYPGIAFHVTQISLHLMQLRELRERNVDLTIGRVVSPLDEDMNAESLFDEHVFVVAGTNCPLARRRKIELAELMNEPWVIPPRDTLIGSLIADIFHAQGLSLPRTTATTASLQLFNALLATGRYLAILPGSMLRFSGKRLGLRLLPVDLRSQPWPVAILTMKNRTLGPPVHLFIDCVREVAKPLANQTALAPKRGAKA